MTEDRFSSISGLLTSKPAPSQATVHPITPEVGSSPPSHRRPEARPRAAGPLPAAKPKSEDPPEAHDGLLSGWTPN